MKYTIANKEDMNRLNKAMNFIYSGINIIDPDAAAESELKSSYVGKYVAKCKICKQPVFISTPEDLVKNNKCPYCKYDDCLVLEGKISALNIGDNKSDSETEPTLLNIYSKKDDSRCGRI